MVKKVEWRKWRRLACEKMPFVEPLLFACSFKEDETIPTACVNVRTLEVRFNPKWMAGRSEQDNAFAFAHEGCHLLLQHGERSQALMARDGDKAHPEVFNIAQDIAVNHVVSAVSGWDVPKDGLPAEPRYEGASWEQIYYDLLKNARTIKGACCKMEGHGKGEKPGAGAALVIEQARDAAGKALQKQAKEGGLRAGKEVGELRELLAGMMPLDKPLDWMAKLKRYLTALDTACKEFDMRCLYKRAMIDRQIVMPNLASALKAKRAGMSVDNSGSVDDEQFNRIASCIGDFAKRVGFVEILVYHFTSEVVKRERYTNLKDLKNFKRVASGGTCITPADIRAGEDRCSFNIILTDGCVDDWRDEYSVPTLVILTSRTPEPPKARNLLGVIYACD